ncbi:MAG: bifunctional nuclease family protein [Chlamydiales bacterium]|nr:bifunctional nuclease family protein [Chlamydiales bacterium]
MQETAELIQIKFDKMTQSPSYTCIILGTEEKKFAIFTEAKNGKLIQSYLTNTRQERPYTHDLMNRIFRGLEIKLKQIVINDLQDTIFFARLFLEQQVGEMTHIVEIDARPSDCITLALLHKVPLYCTREVLEKAVEYKE